MKHTDKKILSKGIKYLGAALPLSFMGPAVLYSAFNNQEHPLYVAVLILGILATMGALFCMFKGILTVVKSMFG